MGNTLKLNHIEHCDSIQLITMYEERPALSFAVNLIELYKQNSLEQTEMLCITFRNSISPLPYTILVYETWLFTIVCFSWYNDS